MDDIPTNVPAIIENAVSGIPKSLVPSALKAVDRLLSAVVDLPVAYLEQQTAKIRAKTASYVAVEAAVANAAIGYLAKDPELGQRATKRLLDKAYRQQENLEKIVIPAIEDLGNDQGDNSQTASEQPTAEIDDDWLNVFERFAQDASSERLQQLWTRILAGEIRTPGRFSFKTLRFLSEFSKADADNFQILAKYTFGEIAIRDQIETELNKSIETILDLEAAGLVVGASGLGFTFDVTFNENGLGGIYEQECGIVFQGEPNSIHKIRIIKLTTLGEELLAIIPDRNIKNQAKKIALALKNDKLRHAYLAGHNMSTKQYTTGEQIW
jgi:hypothetical protein